MRLIVFFLISVLFRTDLLCQNLIENGGFEDVECPGNPINSFEITPTWYVTGADAYWMHVDCPMDPAVVNPIPAIDTELLPNNGNGYISLESVVSGIGFIISEGIGITLAEALQPDRYYYLEYAYLHFPRFPATDTSGIDCDPLPSQMISIYTSTEKIIGTQTYFDPGPDLLPYVVDVSINGDLQLQNDGVSKEGFSFQEWYDYSGCFQAKGSETDLALIGDNYLIPTPNSCFEEESDTYLFTGGFAVDDVKLFLLPERLDTLISLCDGNAEIDLTDLLPAPLLDKGTFLWEDGNTATTRTFNSPGEYQADLIMPCTTIPITIQVDEDLCLVDIYVPNAFSPNFDGVNDRLGPFIDAQLPIQNYLFRVYDRWGNLVFSTENPSSQWDGTFRGINLDQGVFTWLLEYTLVDGRNRKSKQSGDVLLIR